MRFWIIGKRLAEEGTDHEHISHYKIENVDGGGIYQNNPTKIAIVTKSTAVKWASEDGDTFWVKDAGGDVAQATVHRRVHQVRGHKTAKFGSQKVSRWLQTTNDGIFDDNIMAQDNC